MASAGTVLSVGTQTLSVDFTPTDTANYNNASATEQALFRWVQQSGLEAFGDVENSLAGIRHLGNQAGEISQVGIEPFGRTFQEGHAPQTEAFQTKLESLVL